MCTALKSWWKSPADVRTLIVHRRRSSIWRPTLDRDCTNSAVLVALQLNAERSNLKASRTTPPTKAHVETELNASDEELVSFAASQRVQNPHEEDRFAFRFPPLRNRNAFNIHIPEHDADSASEHTSPISDTTLFDDDLDVWPISHQTGSEFVEGRTAESNTSKNQGFRKTCQNFQGLIVTPVERQGIQHSCHASLSSVLDGLVIHQPQQQQQQLGNTRGNSSVDILTAEERDMEYKHRHTFIGTASLDDFLELLEISSSHRVTRSAVARAFVRLASTEQLYARQYSTKSDGWKLVAQTTPDYKGPASVDYVVQSQVKLGTITLGQFLSMILFDQDNRAAAMEVLEAFSAASHIDAKANTEMGSKARAFRSWIVSQRTMQVAAE